MRDNAEKPTFDKVEVGIRETIEVVQSHTAKRIFTAAESKIKHIIENRLLKGLKPVQTGGNSKAKNFSRLEELENLIIAKNVEIEKKELQVDRLFEKFSSGEKKFLEMMN